MDNFYIGGFKNDGLNGENRGWLVGSFMKEGPRFTKDVEVKYWEYPVGETGHPRKISSIVECTFILEGAVDGEIEGRAITLTAGDYIVIQPGTPNNIVITATQAVRGLTIKAPSDITAKQVIN